MTSHYTESLQYRFRVWMTLLGGLAVPSHRLAFVRRDRTMTDRTPGRPLTPRTAAWLALRRPERRDPAGAERLARLGERDPGLAEAVGLAEEFAGLLRAREPGRLDPWLARARGGPLPAFRGFAASLATDEAAVRAAATLPWSTGPVEGQINRLVWGSCGQEESDGYIRFSSGRDGVCGQGRSRGAGPKAPSAACPPLLPSWRRPMRQTRRGGHGCSSLAVAPSRRSIVAHHGDRW